MTAPEGFNLSDIFINFVVQSCYFVEPHYLLSHHFVLFHVVLDQSGQRSLDPIDQFFILDDLLQRNLLSLFVGVLNVSFDYDLELMNQIFFIACQFDLPLYNQVQPVLGSAKPWILLQSLMKIKSKDPQRP